MFFEEAEQLYLAAEPPDSGDSPGDIDRLQRRDRETWLQRIAELTLQGDSGRASQLMQAFNDRFDE